MDIISGFSKLSKREKIEALVDRHFNGSKNIKNRLESFWHLDPKSQEVFDQFSENTISNFYFPYGVVPNFLMNNKLYTVPMVIEESSVVAACSKAAKFWYDFGGFHAKVISTKKVGQIHFKFNGEKSELFKFFKENKTTLLDSCLMLSINMQKRGGGILDIELRDKSDLIENYYQIFATFNTCDAMGANFINSILEQIAKEFKNLILKNNQFDGYDINIIMSILSNYTPECLARVEVRAPVIELAQDEINMSGEEFCQKIILATEIAKVDVNRAVTHNKGIFNGIDAVVLATGNDFRATEACAHAYAARDGQYRGLTSAKIENGEFIFSLEIPISVGTVGGLTSLHPLAKTSLELLGNPGAPELMMICVSTGLAQNFAALRSLVTTGIQKGHMKMHLMNILNYFEASIEERGKVAERFQNEVISFGAVREYLSTIRNLQ